MKIAQQMARHFSMLQLTTALRVSDQSSQASVDLEPCGLAEAKSLKNPVCTTRNTRTISKGLYCFGLRLCH
jgi:hypothetical protein